MAATTPNYKEALTYARRGQPVLPVHSVNPDGTCTCGSAHDDRPRDIGKHPVASCVRNGLTDATTDPDKICEWWRRRSWMNVAIRTGNGLVVIDVDGTEGADSLAELEHELGPLPQTYRVVTGRENGAHLYYTTTVHIRSRDGIRPHLDIKADRAYVIAPPSLHKSGRRYTVADPREPVPLPARWQEHLADRHKKSAASDVRSLDGTDLEKIGEGRRHSILTSIAGSYRRSGMSAFEIQVALDTINQARCVPPLPDDEVEAIATSSTGWTVSDPNPHLHEPQGGDMSPLAALGDELGAYLNLGNGGLDHFEFALAVAATREIAGEPDWAMIVGAPSSSKTEAVRLLDGVADRTLDEFTEAGLLGWTRGKNPRPCGALVGLNGTSGLVTVADYSTVLADSNNGRRERLYGLLRRVYDGSASRDVSPQGGGTADSGRLEWKGRLTVIAACTDAIDNYRSHEGQLGDRWLYWRVPGKPAGQKIDDARVAVRTGADLAAHRQAATELATAIVRDGAARAARIDRLPDLVETTAVSVATFVAYGRAAVPRSSYGRRDVEGSPTVEEPGRLSRQLATLAFGYLGLGFDTAAVARKVAVAGLSSIPRDRRRVLEVLHAAEGETLSTWQVAGESGLHKLVAARVLEDLALADVGLAADLAEVDSDDVDSVRREGHAWALGPLGRLVFDAFAAAEEIGHEN